MIPLRDVGLSYSDFENLHLFHAGRTHREIPLWTFNLPAMRVILQTRAKHVERYSGHKYHSADLFRLWSALIWKYYRSGLSSVDCAKEMGMSPVQVRQQIHRLALVARQLFPELCPACRDFGGPHSRSAYLPMRIAEAEAALQRARTGKRRDAQRAARLERELAALEELQRKRESEIDAATVYSRGVR